jgi:predicted acyl esterase
MATDEPNHCRENVEDLARFYDRYLKNKDNGWERDTPRVRLSLLSFTGKDVIERPETEVRMPHAVITRPVDGFAHARLLRCLQYPLARQKNVTYFLNSANRTLGATPVETSESTSYEAHHLTDSADFTLTFDKCEQHESISPFSKLVS